MKIKNKQKNVPDGWKIKQIQKFAESLSGGTPKSKEKKYYLGGDIPWLKSGEIKKGKISFFNNYITKKGLDNSSAKKFPINTVLVAMYGVTAGKVGILERESSTNQAICGILPNKNYNSYYLYYFLRTRTVQLFRMGTGAAQPNISQEILKNYDVNLPPLHEQKRIVAILETWDSGIEKLKQKIIIKKQIKKGLMQQLLTGKTRLPGFNGEWAVSKLGNVCEIKKGIQLNREHMIEGAEFPVINGGIDPSGQTNISNYKKNTITISEGGNSCGYVNFITTKFWAGGHCYVIAEEKVNNFFLFQLLKLKESSIMYMRVGSGLPNIQRWSLIKYKLSFPILKEQIIIAKILTTAEAEIQKLLYKQKILEDQKKYLLSNLVTGKIRTPENLLESIK